MILGRKELDAMACDPSDFISHKVYLRPRCHPFAAVEVYYDKLTGFLSIECAECNALVADIRVSGRRGHWVP
jgi:hypothetical protein